MVYDPSFYQVMVNGQPKLVSDLTMHELQQSVCHTISVLEMADDKLAEIEANLSAWRSKSIGYQ